MRKVCWPRTCRRCGSCSCPTYLHPARRWHLRVRGRSRRWCAHGVSSSIASWVATAGSPRGPMWNAQDASDLGFTMINLTSVVLEGHGIRLEPLEPGHAQALSAAAFDGRLWELWFTAVPEPDKVDAYI